MTMQLPNLDNRSYCDLVEEALEIIPRYAPAWTNHNASDPGITLIELLAYFTEAIIYRANRLTDLDRQGFLRLLEGDEPSHTHNYKNFDTAAINDRIATIVGELKQSQRAITPIDYEELAIRGGKDLKNEVEIVRAHCLPRKDLSDEAGREIERPGFVSVVVIPDRDISLEVMNQLLDTVQGYLQPRCLLTTRLKVVPPIYVCVSFQVDIGLEEGHNPTSFYTKINNAIETRFKHLHDKERGTKGWSFGRNIYISELIDLLETIDGIDFVRHPSVIALRTHDKSQPVTAGKMGFQIGIRSTIGEDTLFSDKAVIELHRIERDSFGQPMAILLYPHELPRVDVKVGEYVFKWYSNS